MRAALAFHIQKGLSVLEIAVPGHGLGYEFLFRQRHAVQGGHQPDHALFDHGGLGHGDREQLRVDPVGAGEQDVDLRAFLALGFEEVPAVFEIGMPGDAFGQQPARVDGRAVLGGDKADPALGNLHGGFDAYRKQERIDPVLARGEYLDLRPFFSFVFQKRLAVLEGVVSGNLPGKDVARGDRVAVDGLDQPHGPGPNFHEFAFGGLI